MMLPQEFVEAKEKDVISKVAKQKLTSQQELWPERGEAPLDERSIGLMGKAFPGNKSYTACC